MIVIRRIALALLVACGSFAWAQQPVTQAIGPWTTNQTQQAGTTLATPTAYGTAPSGNVPGANSYITNASAIASVPPVVLAQGVNTLKTSSTAVTTLAQAFGSNTTAANSIGCIAFESAAAVPVITDGQNNTYVVALSSATAPGYSVSVAQNIVGGTTDTITETFSSGGGWYECKEFKNGVTIGKAWDYATSLQATSGTLNFQQQSASLPLELIDLAVAMGGGTVNATPAIAGNPSSLSIIDASNVNPDSGGAGAALSDVYSAHTFTSGIPSGFIQNASLSASETYSAVLVSWQPIAATTSTNAAITTVGGAAISLYSTLFNATAATATATSFAVRSPGLSGWGDLLVTFAGITGSPATCALALAYQTNIGTPATSSQTSVALATPANGTTAYRVAPANPSGDQLVATYTCGTYPTAGTMNVTFAPVNFEEAEVQPALWPASYSTNKSFAASSTTDNAVLPGNATNTVLVTRVTVTCTATTAGIQTVTLIKRSAADTSGTSAAFTVVPDDANYIAAVSAPLSYTGTGPSAGAAVGNVDSAQIGCNASATTGPNDVYILDRRLKPIVLRGVAQELAVNVGNAAITGGTLTVTYEWQERP
jgi:hypothetical protein